MPPATTKSETAILSVKVTCTRMHHSWAIFQTFPGEIPGPPPSLQTLVLQQFKSVLQRKKFGHPCLSILRSVIDVEVLGQIKVFEGMPRSAHYSSYMLTKCLQNVLFVFRNLRRVETSEYVDVC